MADSKTKNTNNTATEVVEVDPRRRAVLVTVITDRSKQRQAEEYLDELEFLAETAGIVTVRRFMQMLPSPNSRIYVGPGK